jgi:hypothetical protein
MGTWSGQDVIGTTLVAPTFAIDWPVLWTRTAFLSAFGAFSFVVHGRELLERRRRYRLEVKEEREKMLREAREFRLLHCGRSDGPLALRENAEELIVRDAVDAVHHTIYLSLVLLKTALGCHTCVLLWFDVRNETLGIKELVSDSDAIIEDSIEPARGVIGGITRRREPVNLKDIRQGFRGLSYYREPQKVTSFLGVPVIEHGHLRGVLCVDRAVGKGFSEAEEQVVTEAAAFIVRSIENERMFTSIERTRDELGRFFEASRALNDVLTPEDVYRVALACVARVASYDFAALTDHNTTSALREAQTAAGQDLLILPGMELTTFHGHALALGSGRMHDWRIRDGQSMSARADAIMAVGDLFVIAHPMSLGHPFCTGCAWAWSDMFPGPALLVEVWNGTWGPGPKNPLALDLFHGWLNAGHRLVATAGSDDHGRYGPGVRPGHMLVRAEALSVAGLCAGLARGHAVLTEGAWLMVEGRTPQGGCVLPGSHVGAPVDLRMSWRDAKAEGRLRIVTGRRGTDGVRVALDRPAGHSGEAHVPAADLAGADWAMVELRDAAGGMQALANPVFLGDGWPDAPAQVSPPASG